MNSSDIRARSGARPLPEAGPTGKQIGVGIAVGGGVGVVAALCSLLGTRWYEALVKPQWAPAGWMFAPVQMIVFLLMGVALAFFWACQAPTARKKIVLFWFWAQLALGVAWNLSFFALHSSAWGYAVIMMWWCAVVALIWAGSRLSRAAFWFLTPLIIWVTFASSLTFAVLSFNVLREESALMDADPRNSNSPADPPIIVKKK